MPNLLPVRKLLLRELMALLGLLGLVSVVLIWFGVQGTLERQIDARTQESVLRLERDLHGYLQEAERLGETAGHWLEEGRLQPRCCLTTEGLLGPLLAASPSVHDVVTMGADGTGNAISGKAGHLSAYEFQATQDTVRKTLYRDAGQLLPEPRVSNIPIRYLERPWFLTAQKIQLPQWVGAYPFLSAPVYGLSYVVPVQDDTGQFKAAVCVDVLLDTLSQRVWETRPTPKTRILVCDAKTQVLVAPRETEQAGQFLKPLGDGNFPLFHHLVRTWKSAGHTPSLIRFTHGGQTYAGRVLPLQGSRGADWLVCMAAPERDFQGGLLGLAAMLLGAGTVFLALLAWRLRRFSMRITVPLANLARASEALGKGTMPPPPGSDIQEIFTLGQAFQRAGQALEKESELQLKFQHSQRLETVGTLAGGIAHDVNNQLAAIVGQLNLGREHLAPEHPAARRMEKAEAAAQRCAQMIKSLLGFTHQARPEMQDLDLNELVRRTAGLVERLLGGRVRLDLDLASDLGSVRGDHVSLEQVLMNLAVNARDAMPQGGRLLIATRPGPTPGEICLSVKDTGTGISKEVLPKIFDPFFTTKEVGQGTGLGLAMVFSIVQTHGGRIEVNSRIGEGTEFRILLNSEAAPAPLVKEDVTRDLDEVPFKGRRILVVEDEAPLRELLAEAFTGHQAQVDTARNGSEGWTLWQGSRYDLIISDQRMPELTGLELLARIRATGSQVPVILASGYGLEGLEPELARDPQLRILSKPFSFKRIFALAGELIEGR